MKNVLSNLYAAGAPAMAAARHFINGRFCSASNKRSVRLGYSKYRAEAKPPAVRTLLIAGQTVWYTENYH